MKSLSHVQLFATLWTVPHQTPPSMGFPRQEYWSRLPFPPPEDFSDLGIESIRGKHKHIAKGAFLSNTDQGVRHLNLQKGNNPRWAKWAPALQADSLLSEPPGKSREEMETQEKLQVNSSISPSSQWPIFFWPFVTSVLTLHPQVTDYSSPSIYPISTACKSLHSLFVFFHKHSNAIIIYNNLFY